MENIKSYSEFLISEKVVEENIEVADKTEKVETKDRIKTLTKHTTLDSLFENK